MMMFLLPCPKIVAQDAPHIIRGGDLVGLLAREARISVAIPRVLAEHRIYLERKKASPLDALKSVAAAMNASFVRVEQGYEIRRTATDLAEVRDRRRTARMSWLEKRIESVIQYRRTNLRGGGDVKAIAQTLARDASAREDFARGRRPSLPTTGSLQLLPAATLLEKLALRIGASNLADVPSGTVQIYEDHPVPSATALPPHEDLLREYILTAQRLNEGLTQSVIPEEAQRNVDEFMSRFPKSPSDVFRIRLSCRASDSELSLELELYDRSGKKIDRAFLFTGPTDGRTAPSTFVQQSTKRIDSRWTSLSPSAQKMVASLTGALTATPDWFEDPVSVEPLDGFVREAVQGLTNDDRAACVAFDASDTLWNHVRGCVSRDRVSIDALQETLRTWLPMQRISTAGSTVWRPVDPEADEARRAQRDVLRTFAKGPAGKRNDLRGVCRLFHDASPEVGTLATAWWTTSLRTRTTPAQTLTPEVYAFLGGISDRQWETLSRGGTESIAKLGVEKLLYSLLSRESGTTVMGETPVSDLEAHPLELFVRTSLGTATTSMRVEQQPLVAILTGQDQEPDWLPPQSLDSLLALPPHVFQVTEGNVFTSMTRQRYESRFAGMRFQNGARRITRIILSMPSQRWIAWEIPGTASATAPPFGYGDMPESVRKTNWEKAYEEGIAAAKRRNPSE